MEGNSKGIVSILEKQGRSGAAAPSGEIDGENEYTAYANGRVGTRPQLSIIFRKADESAKAFAYSHLYSVETSDPAAGFVVEFSQTRVTIKGRNLEALLRFICQHRVLEVTEAERSRVFEVAAEQPVVEKIEFRPLTGN